MTFFPRAGVGGNAGGRLQGGDSAGLFTFHKEVRERHDVWKE